MRRTIAAAGGAAVVSAAVAGSGVVPSLVERWRNKVVPPPYRISTEALELHRDLLVADLHADSLLWGRDLSRRASHGSIDVPRMIEGNLALQVFAASTKVPRGVNMELNADTSDNVRLLGLGQRWPLRTWNSRLERALLLADRARRLEEATAGAFTVIRSRSALGAYLERRTSTKSITAGLLSIEGGAALDGDLDNVRVLVDAGFRIVAPTHFTDNEFGGSAHGLEKAGLTALGRELVARLEDASTIVDVAHAAPRTIDDVISVARRPVIASHTGVTGTCASIRNLSDDQLRGLAGTGGVVGIGFWPTATCGTDAAAIARAIAYAVGIVGPDHVALGSDFDGAVPMPFDATGIALLTDALLDEGLPRETIHRVMGGNVFDLLARTLPA